MVGYFFKAIRLIDLALVAHSKRLKGLLDIFCASFKNPIKQIGLDPNFLHLSGER